MCLVKKIAQQYKAQHNVCDHTSWWANPAQKLTRTDICKKISIQLGPNPWWAELAHGFWPLWQL